MKRFLIITGLLLSSLQSIEPIEEVVPVSHQLKQRDPEWRPEIVERFPNGNPKLVFFFEEVKKDAWIPTKRLRFYETGHEMEETDLAQIDEDEPGYSKWNSTSVPHGLCVSYFDQGSVSQLIYYKRGLVHGTCGSFFQSGKRQQVVSYFEGKKHGQAFSNFEDETVSETAQYENDMLVGDLSKFYASGKKSAVIPYVSGDPHGRAEEWHENGLLKATRLFLSGKLHSNGANPAVVLYREDGSMSEVQDFSNGIHNGTHIKYHPGGFEAYQVHYANGKIHGKEQYFSLNGKILGMGVYKNGTPSGRHWRESENGTLVYEAKYDKTGQLSEPIREWNSEGSLISESFLIDDKLVGSCKRWYDNGNLKIEHLYKNGALDGEQKEYYENGQLKFVSHYVDGLQNEDIVIYYIDGKLQLHAHFAGGKKEGTFEEWYSTGEKKIC